MEGLVAWIGYVVTSLALLGLVLVVIRLLPFISTVATTCALLQWVLPDMALFDSAGFTKNSFVFVLATLAIIGGAIDICSIPKRLSHFWDIPKKPYTKD